MELVINECKKGNSRAQKELFDRYAKLMMAVCVRYVKDWHNAEESMLNGFQKFFAAISEFRYINEAGLIAYLKRIMVNECLMQLRFSKIEYLDEAFAEDISFKEETPVDKMAVDELFHLITLLPDGYRTVFNLFVVEGFGHREISAQLGISEGTSKSQLNKARNLLQQLIVKSNENERL